MDLGFLLVGLAVLFIIIGLGIFWLFFRKTLSLLKTVLINLIVGLALVFILGLFGVHVPLNIATVAVIAIFGLAGLGALLLLMFFGIIA